jgi:hypothetical protein
VRITLTLIAVALVAALSAALLAPLFIDWSLHRTRIEAELAHILGARVVVSGPIDIGFLPTPYVELGGVKVFDPARGDPVLTCQGVRLEAALASLPSGRLRLTLARFDHPVFTVSRGDDGSLRLPRWRLKARSDQVVLDRLVATAGRLRVVGGGAPLDVDGINIDATADSLRGPYKGSVVATGGVQASFRFAAGPFEKAALPLKLEVDATAGRPKGLFDGVVTVAPRGSGVALAYSGSAMLSGSVAVAAGNAPSPWMVSGSLHGDAASATLDKLVARFGPEGRELEANGSAQLRMGSSPSLSAKLQAKQLNVDALLRKTGEESVSPARALAAFERVVSPLNAGAGAPMALQVAFSTPTVIVGAQTLTNVAIDANASPGSPIEGDLAAELPGQASLRLSGTLETGSAAQFKGRLAASVGDLGQLRDWAAKDEPSLARRLSLLDGALPYRQASAKGDVEISAVGFSARNLQLVVDRTALSGAMAFTRALGSARGRLFMDLRSDTLDVDALPNLSASSALLGDLDLSLALDAAKLRIARVGEAAIGGGSLSLKLTKAGDDISLDHLSIADLGGAAVEARGATGTQGRWLSVQLKADRLHEFAAMVGRIAPGRLSRLLIQRADALSPAKATFEARAAGVEADAALLDSVKAQGSAGHTQFTFKATRAPGGAGVVANVSLDAAEGVALLQQIGLKPPAIATGPARIEAAANGRWDTGFDAHASASIAGANVAWHGRLKPDETSGDDAPLFGAATVKSDNVTTLVAALGFASSAAPVVVPVDLSGDLVLRGAELRFPRVAGTLAGAKVSGHLTWRPPAEAAPISAAEADIALARSVAGEAPMSAATQIEGELALDRANLGALLSLSLGSPQRAQPGAKRSDARFAPPLVSPPPLDVQLKIDSLEVASGLVAHGATARLKMDRDRLDIDDLAMDVGGGRASGQVTLRRDAAVATLAGRVSVDLPALNWPALRGRVGATLTFASTGQSQSALAAGLVGEGQVQTTGLEIPRLDPGALSRVLARTQAPDARIDETNVVHALGLALDKQPMRIPDGTAPVAMNGGVVHIGPLRLSEKGRNASASADLDLQSRDLTVHATFAEPDGGKFWSGAPPSIAVSVSGPLDAPVRQIDASAFVAGLAAQAIARDSDRIAAVEADIRERAAFNRRLKAERFMRRRELELDAFAQEQARLKSEQERKRVEDELLKASQAQREKSAGTPPVSLQDPPRVGTIDAKIPLPPPLGPTPRIKPADPTASGLY